MSVKVIDLNEETNEEPPALETIEEEPTPVETPEMGTSQNTRYGSRPRTHTRSIPPDPYLDPYPVVLHDPYP